MLSSPCPRSLTATHLPVLQTCYECSATSVILYLPFILLSSTLLALVLAFLVYHVQRNRHAEEKRTISAQLRELRQVSRRPPRAFPVGVPCGRQCAPSTSITLLGACPPILLPNPAITAIVPPNPAPHTLSSSRLTVLPFFCKAALRKKEMLHTLHTLQAALRKKEMAGNSIQQKARAAGRRCSCLAAKARRKGSVQFAADALNTERSRKPKRPRAPVSAGGFPTPAPLCSLRRWRDWLLDPRMSACNLASQEAESKSKHFSRFDAVMIKVRILISFVQVTVPAKPCRWTQRDTTRPAVSECHHARAHIGDQWGRLDLHGSSALHVFERDVGGRGR